jgi:hypothetical protein
MSIYMNMSGKANEWHLRAARKMVSRTEVLSRRGHKEMRMRTKVGIEMKGIKGNGNRKIREGSAYCSRGESHRANAKISVSVGEDSLDSMNLFDVQRLELVVVVTERGQGGIL